MMTYINSDVVVKIGPGRAVVLELVGEFADDGVPVGLPLLEHPTLEDAVHLQPPIQHHPLHRPLPARGRLASQTPVKELTTAPSRALGLAARSARGQVDGRGRAHHYCGVLFRALLKVSEFVYNDMRL